MLFFIYMYKLLRTREHMSFPSQGRPGNPSPRDPSNSFSPTRNPTGGACPRNHPGARLAEGPFTGSDKTSSGLPGPRRSHRKILSQGRQPKDTAQDPVGLWMREPPLLPWFC